MKTLFRLLCVVIVISVCSLMGYGQGSLTSSLSGAVTDPTGAVVAGANITVKNNATGQEFQTISASNGTYTVPALGAGIYTVTVSAAGFKQALVKDIKIDAAIPATANVVLEVGATSDTVVIQGGGEVLQTQSASISTTITGRQITELPFTSRNATDLLLYLPGTTTPGRPRSSTFNGLPQGAINMTLDGVSIQDNGARNTDGFYTNIYPRTDAVEEVTLSTATPGAESGGEGAVQIKLVTRQGGNEYHGSLYEYHRNTALNANYWFNNRTLRPGPNDDPATFKAGRDILIVNQAGGRFGGPITLPKKIFGPIGFDGHDKAFFFVNYEQFRLATSVSQTRTVLNPLALQGIFQYNTSSGVRQVNLLTLAASKGAVSTLDPTVNKLLNDIKNSTANGSPIQSATDPNLQTFSFGPSGGGEIRIFPTVRFDFNLSSKHHLEEIYINQSHHTLLDYLNGGAPAFPGFPNIGSQKSARFTNSLALRSTLASNIVNEARFGLTGGTVVFNGENSLADFTGPIANQAGFNLGINAADGITTATVNTASNRRNSPTWTFDDSLNWTHGSHSFNLGGRFFQANYFATGTTFVPGITFGIDTSDIVASSIFNSTNGPINFPGSNATDVARAQGIYATLIGSITAINANAGLNETTGKYTYLNQNTVRARNREIGFYGQDSWRMRPNLTLNYGLRWEVQFPVTSLNNNLTNPTLAGLYGVSGPGNIFKPNTLTGSPTQFFQFKEGDTAYKTDWNNLAPSFGFAWSPSWKSGLLSHLFGSSGQSVFRGGFSLAFNRDGINTLIGTISANPGGTITVNRNIATGNLVTNVGSDRLPVLLSQTSRLGPPTFPDTPVYPITGAITNAATTYDPNLKTPYIMSWTFGFQREITKDMVIEARYVGNRALNFRQGFNVNELDLVESGFLNEFKLAQANLQANVAAGRGSTFRYFGAGTNTSPLPIILGYFSGVPAAQANDTTKYTSTNFTSSTFINPLAATNSAPATFVNSLIGSATFRGNATTAGLPVNLFLTNPGLQGGATFVGNGGHSYYDSGVIELRRRLSKGLLVQGSYTYAHGFEAATPSLRTGYYKRPSSIVITHAFKADWIYDLPLGRGHALFGNSGGVIGKLAEGWQFNGTARIQSGSPFNINDVRLVGMTLDDLRKAVKPRFDSSAAGVYYLPQDIIDNTIKAFTLGGTPTGRYIAPASTSDCVEVYTGQCGFSTIVLYGPSFTRFDLSMIKKTKISERVNMEFRTEFLNAFNYANFSVGNPANSATTVGGLNNTTFGQLTQSYRDISTTNDPGGRMIQFVLRLNF